MTDNKYKKNIGKINRVNELTKTSVLGLLSNLFLFMTKVLMYFFTGSMSILSEALNNLSDCSSSIISIMGVKFAQKPNDKSHPYGHGRIEYLITLVISGMVLVVGGNFVYFSFKKIIHPQALNYPFYTLVLLFLSLLVKIWQSGFYLKKSKLLNSLALKAQSKDSLSDCLITSVVLIGVIIQKFTGLKIDSYIGLLVALFIIYTAIELINQTISILIGKGLSEELRQEIISKVSSYEGISNVHSIIVTDFGPENIIVILDAEIAYNLSLEEAHNIVDKVEREVSKLLNIKDHIKDESRKNMDPINAFFYTLIGMTTIYGYMWGLFVVYQYEANLSVNAKRNAVAPIKKSVSLLASVLVSWLINFIITMVFIFYLDRALGVDFGDRKPLLILLSLASSLTGVAFGIFIGVSNKKNIEFKINLGIAITMLMSFLSGMMISSMKVIIQENFPILGKINPVAVVTDAIYSLYYYDSTSRFYENLGLLVLISAVFLAGSMFFMRGKEYESL